MARSFRVLLVEDNDPLRGCLDEFLASRGWTVRSTGYGQEAVELALSMQFDFSILDFHLRGMTGLEVFQAITRQQPMPSIMMSGEASHEETVAAQSAGVFTFLQKPFELNRLRSTVDLLIRHHFSRLQLRPPGPTGNPGSDPGA